MKEETHADFSERISEMSAGSGRPVDCHWDVTHRCNLACRHCYLPQREREKGLDTRQAISIMDELCAGGCLYLTLSGGEPFTREDFLDIYSAAREKGFLITLFTNGTLITEDAAMRLERQKPVMIEITVHSLREEVFDAITQVRGSFEACMRGIRLLHSRGLPLVLKVVGMNDNADEICRIKEFALSMDGVQFKFDPLVLPRHDLSREPCAYRIEPAKIAKIEQSDEDMRAQWRRYLESDRCDGSLCAAGVTSFYLDPHGRVRLCPHMIRPSYDLTGGTLNEGVFPFLRETRKRLFTRPSECRDCEAADFCSQCPARALLESGNPGRPAEYLCRLAHERLKILGKEYVARKVFRIS